MSMLHKGRAEYSPRKHASVAGHTTSTHHHIHCTAARDIPHTHPSSHRRNRRSSAHNAPSSGAPRHCWYARLTRLTHLTCIVRKGSLLVAFQVVHCTSKTRRAALGTDMRSARSARLDVASKDGHAQSMGPGEKGLPCRRKGSQLRHESSRNSAAECWLSSR